MKSEIEEVADDVELPICASYAAYVECMHGKVQC
jgi:hypothetical protein